MTGWNSDRRGHRRWLPAALVLAAIGFHCAACGGVPRPNVLLIVIDTARADRFSFNGYARDTSPVTAALGIEGAVYTNAYTPSPWTLPAHASLFTGLFPSAHGADSGALKLDSELPLLARRFREAGYRTVGYTENPWIGRAYNFHLGFESYEEIWRDVSEREVDAGAGLTNGRVESYLEWRDENLEAAGTPFFMFINYLEPHLPYDPPEPERSRFLSPGQDRGAAERLRRFKHPEEVKQILGVGMLGEADFPVLSDLYDGEIAYVDRRIGEVIDLLRRRHILDRTVVAITSDHGEMLGEHGFVDHKLNVYEPLLRIPMVLRYPPAIPPGQRIGDPVMLQDLYPTLLMLAGIEAAAEAKAPLDGMASEALPLPGVVLDDGRGRTGKGRGPLWISEYAPQSEFLEVVQEVQPAVDTIPWERTLVAYRAGDLKLHWASDGKHRLHDLRLDPGEDEDLAATRDARVEGLVSRVEMWLRRPNARPPIGIPTE